MRTYINNNYPWRMFEELTGTSPSDWMNLTLRNRNDPYPFVTTRETEAGQILEAELPGVGPEAVNISVEGNVLTIKGERTPRGSDEKQAFERSFTIPLTLEVEKMTATLKHGLLTITIPKREEAKPRRIEITAT
jgi:HSP20 family protein